MIHTMKLQPTYYNFILNGTKRIELRLLDEKRQQIKIGDTIKFLKEPDLTKKFEAIVIDLYHYKSFAELLQNFDISILADASITKEQLLEDLEKYYDKESQNKYGVLGIKFMKK